MLMDLISVSTKLGKNRLRGGGTGGAIAPPIFGSPLSIHPLAPPTFLVRSIYNSSANLLYLPLPQRLVLARILKP